MPSLDFEQRLQEHRICHEILNDADLSQLREPIGLADLKQMFEVAISEGSFEPQEKEHLKTVITDAYVEQWLEYLALIKTSSSDETKKSILESINKDLHEGEERCTASQLDSAFVKTYLAILPLIKSMAEKEQGTQQSNALAYKLAMLFKDENAIVVYLEQFNQKYQGESPLHDATLFNLPFFQNMHLESQHSWHLLAQKYLGTVRYYDVRFLDLLNYADKLSELKTALPQTLLDYQTALHEVEEKPTAGLSRHQRIIRRIEEKATQTYDVAKEKAIRNALGKLKKSLAKSKKEPSEAEIRECRETAITEFERGASKGIRKSVLKEYIAPLETFSLGQLELFTPFCGYERAAEYPLAAEILMKMKVPERFFNEYLDLLKKRPPESSDHVLPPVLIEGGDVGCEGFYLIKLSANDPKAAFLGYPTGCCQSIGSVGASCAVYGVMEENAGFYVLCKGKPSKALKKKMEEASKAGHPLDTSTLISAKSIVAQSWVWRAYDKDRQAYSDVVVLDNIEASSNLGYRNTPKLFRLYALLAQALIARSDKGQAINAVNIGIMSGVRGLGYQALDEDEVELLYKKCSSDSASSAEQYSGYSDAELQAVMLDTQYPAFLDLLNDDSFDRGLDRLKAHENDPDYFEALCCFLPALTLVQAKQVIEIIKTKKIELSVSFYNFLSTPAPLALLLQEIPEQLDFDALNELDQNDDTLLHVAFSHKEAFKLLITLVPEEALFNAIVKANHKGESILHRAVKEDEIIELILARLSPEHKLEALKLGSVSRGRYVGSRRSVMRVLFEHPQTFSDIFNSLSEKERMEVLKHKGSKVALICHQAVKFPLVLAAIKQTLPMDQFLSLYDLHNTHNETILHRATSEPDSFKILVDALPEGTLFDRCCAKNTEGETVFFQAAKHLVSLKTLLSSLTALEIEKALSMEDKFGQRLLHVTTHSPEAITYLLSLYQNKEAAAQAVCFRDKSGNSALHYAASSPDSFVLLLNTISPKEKEMVVTIPNTEGESVLLNAIGTPQNLELILNVIHPEIRLRAVTSQTVDGDNACFIAIQNTESLTIILQALPETERLKALMVRAGNGETALERLEQYPKSFDVIITLLPENERYQVLRSVSEFWLSENKIDFHALYEKTGSPLLKLVRDVLEVNQHMQSETPRFFSSSKAPVTAYFPVLDLCRSATIKESCERVLSFLRGMPQEGDYKKRLLNRLVLSAEGDVSYDYSEKIAFLEQAWTQEGLLKLDDISAPSRDLGFSP